MNIKIGDIAATSFVTLYCHAIESQSRDPILNNPKAVEITHELNKILCDSNNKLELKKPLKRMVHYKMQHRGHLGKDATFHFGIRDSKEMEGWNAGIQFLDDWSYFDSEEKKLGWLKMFRNSKLFRKTQWTVHYKLN